MVSKTRKEGLRRVVSILYFVCATLLSLWCVDNFMPIIKPEFSTQSPPEKVRIVFAGDVMMHTPQIQRAKGVSGYDFNSCFRYVKPILETADIAVVNLETTLSKEAPYSGYPLFRSPSEVASSLANAGVDVAITANNHSLDSGARGLVTTIDILEEHGIKSVGTYKDSIDYVNRNPLILNSKGVKIALLSYTYGTNGIPIPEEVGVNLVDTVQMKRDIAHSLAMGADCVISYLHWGAEYSHRPNQEQRQIAQTLHRAGCQVVVGSHPHVVQGAEISKQEVTIYSLGNFISNQRMQGSDGGIIAQLDIEKSGDGCQFWLDIIPVWVRQSDYAVIPCTMADTLSLTADERTACRLFLTDVSKKF